MTSFYFIIFRHITTGFECLDALMTTCMEDERKAIADGVLKVLRQIKGSMYCNINLDDKICAATRRDSSTDCDFAQAQICEDENMIDDADSEEEKCM